MPITRNRTLCRSDIIYIPIDEISPCPFQPRKVFVKESLNELASSIAEFGILNPLTVRERNDVYELVAGERRLRAAEIAGLSEVPCIILDIDMEESAAISLVENLQRSDLNSVEEAEGIAALIELFGMSQEDAAKKLGKSQPAIANKLRLLKLPPEVLELLRQGAFGERQARALLRLPPEHQYGAAKYIVSKGLTAAASEAYVDRLLEENSAKISKRRTFVMKDIKLFVNTVSKGLELMRQGGIDSEMSRLDDDNMLTLTIRISKKA